MNKYQYESPVGTFYIEPDTANSGQWRLRVDQKPLGIFGDPRGAAIEVAAKRTGYSPWDETCGVQFPVFLDGWRKA